MIFYRPNPKKISLRSWLSKCFETGSKCGLIIGGAALTAWVFVEAWYRLFYLNHVHVDEKTREVLIVAVIPASIIMYSVLSLCLVTEIFKKYKAIRMAIKKLDIETFMCLADEDLSPLLHSFCAVLAMIVLGELMLVEHSGYWHGALVIGGMSLVFGMLCLIVIAMDDPLHGLWVIKNVPEGWLDITPKEWRRKNIKARAEVVIETVVTVEPAEVPKKAA